MVAELDFEAFHQGFDRDLRLPHALELLGKKVGHPVVQFADVLAGMAKSSVQKAG